MIQIESKIIAVAILLLLALISDFATYKIKNTITYGFMLVGFVSNSITKGLEGIIFSLQGILLPVLCLIVLYMLGTMGAGDIKLFSSIGAIMGAGFVLGSIVFSFLFGGVIAATLMLIRRNGAERLKYLGTYIKSCIMSMTVTRYADFGIPRDGSRFHFSVAVASGTVAAIMVGRLGFILF
ncbi:MAG: prepilin peptidase [Pseudomonadota bacterium]